MFPLPLGDSEYGNYMALVRKRFPPGELRTVMRGGQSLQSDLSRISEFCFRRRSLAGLCTDERLTGAPLVNSR